MSEQYPAALVALLWKDIDETDDLVKARPLLAHYTSVATLEKIVQHDTLWFSNPLYMNDWEELHYGMNLGAHAFRTHSALERACRSPENFKTLQKIFSRLFDDFDRNHALDTYILCLAEHDSDDEDGALSMWRGYGVNGNGVALVFDSARLRAKEGSPFVAARVTYASHLQRQEWVVRSLDKVAELLREQDPTEATLAATAHYFFERLKLFALFTKHCGFREEREWRVVYFSQKDTQRVLAPMLGYALTTRGVEPKLKFELVRLPEAFGGPMNLEEIISHLLLGPSISTVASISAVCRMLTLLGKLSLASRVRASSIPYRT